MLKTLSRDRLEKLYASSPLEKRLGLPSEVADIIAFLYSNESHWINGQAIVIDGGLLSNQK